MLVIIADLDASSVVPVDRHQDHQRCLQEGRDDDGEDDANDLHEQLVVLQAQHYDESEDGVGEISKDTELKDGLKLILHTVIRGLALRPEWFSLQEVASLAGIGYTWAQFYIAASIVRRLGVHDREENPHKEEQHAVDNLAPDELFLVILIHDFVSAVNKTNRLSIRLRPCL